MENNHSASSCLVNGVHINAACNPSVEDGIPPGLGIKENLPGKRVEAHSFSQSTIREKSKK